MATEAGHAGTDAAQAAAGTTGMPQLDFSTYPNQIFWLLVAMVAIYLILSRVALPRIGAVLGDRQGTITSDIATAEELKLKAVEAEEAFNKALADARAEAHKIIAEAKTEIQAELDEAIVRADAEIAAKSAESEARIGEIRAGALDAVTIVAKDTAKEIVAAMGQSANASAVAAAVDARLKG